MKLELTPLELAVLHYCLIVDQQSEPLKDFEVDRDFDCERPVDADAALESLKQKIRSLFK